MANYLLRVWFFVSGMLISGSHSAQGSRFHYFVQLSGFFCGVRSIEYVCAQAKRLD